MRILIDTNIFLEIILEQTNAKQAKDLLAVATNPNHEFFITDYSLHSIGLVLFRAKKHDTFRKFLRDMPFGAGIAVASLRPDEMGDVINAARKFKLDFDDAYQYAAAEKRGLELVSFDSDFDRTERRRTPPDEMLMRMFL